MNQMVTTHHVRYIFMPCQPKYQENLLAMQQFVKSIPQTVFAKNNQMRTV